MCRFILAPCVCVCVCVCSRFCHAVGTSMCLHSHVMGTYFLLGTKNLVPTRKMGLNDYISQSIGAGEVSGIGP